MVEDEDVEEEEEDLEVKKIFEDSKQKHRAIMKGMHRINVLNCTHVGDVKDVDYEYNVLNGTHVGEVRDTCS